MFLSSFTRTALHLGDRQKEEICFLKVLPWKPKTLQTMLEVCLLFYTQCKAYAEYDRGHRLFFTKCKEVGERIHAASKLLLWSIHSSSFRERNLTLQDHYLFQRSFCNLLIMMSKVFKEQTEKFAWEFLLKEHINILSDMHKCIAYTNCSTQRTHPSHSADHWKPSAFSTYGLGTNWSGHGTMLWRWDGHSSLGRMPLLLWGALI